jgi:uncharacterized protein (TIGR03083 family)
MLAAISPPSVGRLCDALDRAGERFVALLRLGPEPSAPAIGRWSVGDTAVHASWSPTYFLGVVRGEMAEPEALDDVARNNARVLAADPERDPRVLADRLDRTHAEFVSYVRTVDGDPVVRPFAGVDVPLSTVLAVELGELLVHGEDIARAARLPWRIPRGEAALTLEGFLPILPFAVDERRAAGRPMRCELPIRGGARARVVLEDGALRVEPASSAPVDCRVSADPVALLRLVFHRTGTLKPILRGELVAWGRRPWRAMTLPRVLKTI